MGTIARNLLLSLEYLYDHPLHLFLLAGPDYSEPAVREMLSDSLIFSSQVAKLFPGTGWLTVDDVVGHGS